MADMEKAPSTFVKHVPCPNCGSPKAGSLYSDGHIWCFKCEEYFAGEGSEESLVPVQRKTKKGQPFVDGDVQALASWGISEDTCARFRYQVGKVPKDYPAGDESAIGAMKGKKVHIENFYDEKGTKVGQHLRDAEKNFAIIGDISELLWGRHCTPAGQKVVVITEGAKDALAYAEVRKNWPVLSIPSGASSAKKAFAANVEYLETFEKVIIAFDNDEAGDKAVEAVKGILSPGKLHIAHLNSTYKDFHEAFDAGDVKSILNAVFEAEEYRPDGLVDIDDILEDILKPVEMGLPWFIPELTDLTYGRRYTEVYGFGAGTGVGKTDWFAQQIAFDIFELKLDVGIFFFEQKPKESAKRIAGKYAGQKFHVPQAKAGWDPDDLRSNVEKMRGRITFYDSFGQTDWGQVKNRIRYLNKAKGIRVFYIDHLTAMADTADEKGSLEQIMKEVAGLANELDAIIHYVSHLSTPESGSHETGAKVMIKHFKGSRSIGFWSYFMFGLERDQQAEDPEERSTTTFRILKDRYTGESTGQTLELGYDNLTGRIIPPTAKGFDDERTPYEEQF